MNSHSKQATLFDALGVEHVEIPAVELARCRTLIQAHLGKLRSGNLDETSRIVLRNIVSDIVDALYIQGSKTEVTDGRKI